jgi:hypothetical protein
MGLPATEEYLLQHSQGVSMQLGRYQLLCEVVVYWSASHICNWALLVIKGKKPSEKV